MTYAQYGNIQAEDFNTFVGTSTGATANTLNAVWANGSAGAGYGQTFVANVAVGNTVKALEWNTFVSRVANSAAHQGSSIATIVPPQEGNTIAFISTISTNLNTIYTNRFWSAAQGTTVSNSAVTTSTWSNSAVFTHTATFANGDAARYFFNSGGQLAITCSHPSGTSINLLLNNLASNVGTVVLSAMSSGNATIAGTSYRGVTKVGGGGNTPVIANNNGYYALTTSNANVFYQTASTGPSGYLSTNINLFVKSNGTQGSRGDVGNVITIYTVWDEIPNGITVGVGSNVTLTARPPQTGVGLTGNLSNTWGTITLAGTVAVS